jgi:hypothetical protein
MGFFDYKDTVVEDVESIKESRSNINKGACLTVIPYAIFFFMGVILHMMGYIVTGIYFIIIAVAFLILMMGLVLKREMYSIMIYLKEEK